jgi:hypothetical protein
MATATLRNVMRNCYRLSGYHMKDIIRRSIDKETVDGAKVTSRGDVIRGREK